MAGYFFIFHRPIDYNAVMKYVDETTVDDLIRLSTILGGLDQIKRATFLPDGSQESDSHHSFSLALIAFELAHQYAPELDRQKLLSYALVHDLSELITGDVNTLMLSAEELAEKKKQDDIASKQIVARLSFAPHIAQALEDYEARAGEESLFIYWLDKIVTIPNHFNDSGAALRAYGVNTKQDLRGWYERISAKLSLESKNGHESMATLLDLAHQKLQTDLF